MDYLQKLITDLELHSADGIKECFENGINPNAYYNGQPLIYELTSEYLRSPTFKDCVRVFADFGLNFDDKYLLAVLMDDDRMLEQLLTDSRDCITRLYTIKTSFTPIYEASLLHICAEFNHLHCAKILLQHGAYVNAKAGEDSHGFGGQTPIFHTVNQHRNQHKPMLKLLVENGADLSLTVKGLIWGKGYHWETFIPSVNPVSYAMMGLLPQFQRSEKDIYDVVLFLMEACYNISYQPANVPNRYLAS